LNSQVAIVKGPPGTGKTFIGIKAVEVISKHLKKSNQQIVMICYTNHALDQFLEGISEFEKNIVRIGGRSKSENSFIQSRNLSKLRENYRDKNYGRIFAEYNKISNVLSSKWQSLLDLKKVEKLLQIFSMKSFLHSIKKISDGNTTFFLDDTSKAVEIWINGSEGEYIKNIKKTMEKKE